jgi:pyridoxal phosphate enzyme (YggS family)
MTAQQAADLSHLKHNLEQVHARILTACQACGRPVEDVQLLAVSKTFPAQSVAAMAGMGQSHFGENYVQEGIEKIRLLDSLGISHLIWHFIGPLQSNKTRQVAEHFDWVHTVSRDKIAERLAEQRPANLPALNICLQVKTSGEDSKSGVLPAELPALARTVANLPQLRLRGLMTLPEPGHEDAEFAQLKQLFDQLKADYPTVDTLSVGMSADLESAIAHGSTCVRIGSALFGQRTPKTR